MVEELNGKYLDQYLVIASEESMRVPSMSERIPANMWVNGASNNAPSGVGGGDSGRDVSKPKTVIMNEQIIVGIFGDTKCLYVHRLAFQTYCRKERREL